MLRLRVTQRLPAAHEERPAGPQHDGRGEGELDPVRQRRIDQTVPADEMAAHFEDDRRQRQHEADPEAARHVGELGIGRRVEADDVGLQRHAADRTAAGTDLADLRMHRAGVDRAFRHRRFRPLVLFQIGEGVGGEFGSAAGGAEMEGFAVVIEAVLAGRGIDRHAADGVAHGCRPVRRDDRGGRDTCPVWPWPAQQAPLACALPFSISVIVRSGP